MSQEIPQPTPAEIFWQSYLATLPADAPAHTQAYTIWQFADTPEDATSVGNLVRAGVKTTTSCLVREMEQIGEALPQAGDIAIVTGGDDLPLCIIEVTEVEVKPFDAVDAQFAYDYGEWDRTLEGWRAASWEYWSRHCRELGYEPSPEMLMGCQRFRVLYPK
jgi:uncharacterized protein YhfF